VDFLFLISYFSLLLAINNINFKSIIFELFKLVAYNINHENIYAFIDKDYYFRKLIY
jgi:hypothetical protein